MAQLFRLQLQVRLQDLSSNLRAYYPLVPYLGDYLLYSLGYFSSLPL